MHEMIEFEHCMARFADLSSNFGTTAMSIAPSQFATMNFGRPYSCYGATRRTARL
jgi:hypothetical protein